MKILSVLAGLLALALPVQPVLSQEPKPRISETAVRIISARAYSDLLLQAYEKGWHYPPSQIAKGFRRHFEELKLQLEAQGYTIVAEEDASSPVEQRDL